MRGKLAAGIGSDGDDAASGLRDKRCMHEDLGVCASDCRGGLN